MSKIFELLNKQQDYDDVVFFTLFNETSHVVLTVEPRQMVIVYGEPQAGKSAFLLSICGVLSLKYEMPIVYLDLEGKDDKRAKLIRKLNKNFKYIFCNPKEVDKTDILEFVDKCEYRMIVIDAYNLLFTDQKYLKFLNELRNIVLRDNKTLYFSSQTYKLHGQIYPYGGKTALHPTDYSIHIKKVSRSQTKRIIFETRYGIEKSSLLEKYERPNWWFFDFFVNELKKS